MDRKKSSLTVISGCRVIALSVLIFSVNGICDSAEDEDKITVSAFELPRYSVYLSQESRQGIEKTAKMWEQSGKHCNLSEMEDGPSIRACEAKIWPPVIAAARQVYDVDIESKTIAGVYTDVVTPADGVALAKQNRVLINLHGGAFKYGARYGGQMESIPIAALGKYRVIAVDYRQAPEHHFPAASIDVAKVYRELLKDYEPENIGIYGCSAGSRLAGESIAWFHKEGLPGPGAVAMLCSAPTRLDGDSNYTAFALSGREPMTIKDIPYWQGVSPDNALAFPGESPQMLAIFPPSLLMTSSRDYSVSPMSYMHSQLVKLGIETELHILEGFRHAEFLGLYVPESRHAAQTVIRFFDRWLGKSK